MIYFVGFLIFIGVYLVAKILFSKVDTFASVADVLAFVVAAFFALMYVGGIRL